jgi:hypothetical protein
MPPRPGRQGNTLNAKLESVVFKRRAKAIELASQGSRGGIDSGGKLGGYKPVDSHEKA